MWTWPVAENHLQRQTCCCVNKKHKYPLMNIINVEEQESSTQLWKVLTYVRQHYPKPTQIFPVVNDQPEKTLHWILFKNHFQNIHLKVFTIMRVVQN